MSDQVGFTLIKYKEALKEMQTDKPLYELETKQVFGMCQDMEMVRIMFFKEALQSYQV